MIRRKFGKKRLAEIKRLIESGCNVDEVMAFYRISQNLAHALMDCARRFA